MVEEEAGEVEGGMEGVVGDVTEGGMKEI